MITITNIPYKITKEDRETAHSLLDQLLDKPEKNTIIWERAWIEDVKIRRTRYTISIDIKNLQ